MVDLMPASPVVEREYPRLRLTGMTVEEFEAFARLPKHGDTMFEYIQGEVWEVVSDGKSSILGMLLGSFITIFVKRNKLGWVTGADGGYMIGSERYIPDVGYISRSRQPHEPNQAYNPLAPDLVVEVLSPSNTAAEMRIKIVNYLQAGTVVWLADPDAQTLEVYTPNKAPFILQVDDPLDGGNVLPGFTLPLREIFDAETSEKDESVSPNPSEK
jgi:Uma2 family endonuclease